ncbi:hypothetical protein GCM10009122_38040 [Fulvivirga kasyanovii]|uniref:Uncharacterized protein n=1 Tax=Fulvivirga kasyanovii TaxID=396812 RepID=A0ABW9RPP2_9BACT|nr:hypothetical protein [Fulvivirga kasyanovii]MTI25722.1 hypothetical protein [Fulvivirga kasyanovii]
MPTSESLKSLNMGTIVALRGRASSGKTSAIRILYELLLQNGFQLVRGNFRDSGGDFLAVFSKQDKLLGVTSSGDTYDLVHDRLEELTSDNCLLCICACRTFDRVPPGTNAAIREFVNYENRFIDKMIDTNEVSKTSTNEQDAQNLLSVINDLF